MVVSLAAAVYTGCGNSVPEVRDEAIKRWGRTRSEIICELAEEHLKTGALLEAKAKAKEAMTTDPEHAAPRVILAKIEIEQGHYTAAITHLQQARRLGGQSEGLLYLLGVALEKAGHLPEALAAYRQAQALGSGPDGAAVRAAAEVLVLMSRPKDALAAVEGHVKQDKGDPGASELAGRVAMILGEHSLAADYCQQACDLDTENMGYRAALARAQYLAGRYAGALRTLAVLKDSAGPVGSPWVHAMTGDCLMAMNRPQEAKWAYREACRLAPSSCGLLVKTARAELAAEAPDEAAQTARKALALDARSAEAAMLLGYALIRGGHQKRAIVALTEASWLHPSSSIVWCLLGRAHAEKGSSPEAKQCYKTALGLEPNSRLAKELIASLDPKDKERTE